VKPKSALKPKTQKLTSTLELVMCNVFAQKKELFCTWLASYVDFRKFWGLRSTKTHQRDKAADCIEVMLSFFHLTQQRCCISDGNI